MGGTTFHVLYGGPAALLPTGGTTFHVLYGVVSRRRMRDVVFASRPFKVGTLFCRLMTKAELLQVCRVSNHDFLLLLLLLLLSSSFFFFLLLVLLCVFLAFCLCVAALRSRGAWRTGSPFPVLVTLFSVCLGCPVAAFKAATAVAQFSVLFSCQHISVVFP